MRASLRTRLLLLGLGAAAVAWAWTWDVDDTIPPARGDATRLVPAAAPRIPTYYPGGGLPDFVMPDSEFAEMLPEFGVLLMLRHENPAGDTASFYRVVPRDSTRSLRDLGFVQVATLLDSTAEFETLGDSLPSARVRSRSRAGNDSVLRRRDPDCVLESPITLAGPGAASSAWIMALAPGAAEALPPGAWRAPASNDDRRLALSLAERIGPDSSEQPFAGPHVLAALPFTLAALRRFTIDSTEYLIADVRRQCRGASCFSDQQEIDQEQRVFIAERVAGDANSTFRVRWRHYEAGSLDQNRMLEPVLMLRMGPGRLPVLYMTTSRGGIFLGRHGASGWAPIAEWYGGC